MIPILPRFFDLTRLIGESLISVTCQETVDISKIVDITASPVAPFTSFCDCEWKLRRQWGKLRPALPAVSQKREMIDFRC